MNILVACEESQAVCKAFRERGHNAFSCDLIPCSGGHPEWHIIADALTLIDGDCVFTTEAGERFVMRGEWDMLLAFPPCTHLCASGQSWFSRGLKDPQLREDAVSFFMRFVNADCDHIAIENPVGVMSTRYRKPDQIIQPYEFGHPETKRTCLWLKGLPLLKPTQILAKPEGGWNNQQIRTDGKYGGFLNRDERGRIMSWNDPRTAIIRSKTYKGIAEAMAEQWGKITPTRVKQYRQMSLEDILDLQKGE